MQITVNSPNIITFGFSVRFNLLEKTITFDTTQLTVYNNSSNHGALFVQGISFGLTDQDGVELVKFDLGNPQLPTPATQGVYTFDASYLNYAFLFQNYKFTGGIKDQNGMIYTVNPVYKEICQPTDFNDAGYVDGTFQIAPDCVNNIITVKELTNFALCNKLPESTAKNGSLYYPTGTIAAVPFTFTPFSNNVIYTGQYRLNNSSTATYNLGDDVYEIITFTTNNVFDVTCANRMSDILCCITNLQKTKEQNCENAIGQRAAQQLDEINLSFMLGLAKEANGQDASVEAAYIKKALNCSCGTGSILQNEFDPANGAVSSLVITGAGGTTVDPTISGITKRFVVTSSVYQVIKDNSLDTSFYITVDTATPNTVKYKIGINYNALSTTILNTIAGDQTLINLLNSLVTATTNIDLSNLDGKCIINLGATNYFLSTQTPFSNTLLISITIGATTHNAPANLLLSDISGVASFLNGLGQGVYQVSYVSGSPNYFNILSNSNTFNPLSIVIKEQNGLLTKTFQHTNTSLVAFLQALVDYLCNITALQVALGQNLAVCTFDYSGNIVVSNFTTGQSQGAFNTGISQAICNIANRINTLTGITCAAIATMFQDYPNSPVYRLYGNDGNGNCVSFDGRQLGLAVIASINSYQLVKDAFCSIDCAVPALCPDVQAISLNMAGAGNLGVYGLTWTNVPTATQTVTVKYKLHTNTLYIVATNNLQILPNGNILGTTPFVIPGLTSGTTYDVQVVNNCGGVGFITQFTTPNSGVYTQNMVLDNVLYLICSLRGLTTLYSSSPFGTGVTMYTDFALTTPVTGYVYILNPNTGEIYAINTSTGVVGADTGNNCNIGTPNAYILGNSTGSVCSNATQTLYTNGAFAVGKTLYRDAALTTVQTGFTYVVYNNIIFSLNTSTGVIGGSTGLSCVSSTTLTLDYSTGTFSASLSNVLPFDITLDNATANGGTSAICSSTLETDNLTSETFTAGTSIVTQTNTGITCASTYYRLANKLGVNGTLVTNGGTIVVSGVTITVVILHLSCSPYTC